ncbi:MAG: YadA C-terminal domain-containing protein [Pasteurellaceae bacterium]|nr:YadA C-terminal domain-containing protein [Pasteurellaceae bacterium]
MNTLTTTVNNNTQTIKTINQRVDNVEQSIKSVKKDMRKGFAQQAALSGLFQPYNVGKFNVTASVGGYGSETAIAVGTGYRFNQSVAVKAGIATSTRDTKNASYNAAINYEW